LKCRPETEAQILAMTFTHDAGARTAALRCPMTQVFGLASAQVQQEGTRAFARLTGTLAVPVNGLSHFGPMEQPAAIAQLVAAQLMPSVEQ
jgi:pimeloyl-ACP methyl ester carboxylesterase